MKKLVYSLLVLIISTINVYELFFHCQMILSTKRKYNISSGHYLQSLLASSYSKAAISYSWIKTNLLLQVSGFVPRHN